MDECFTYNACCRFIISLYATFACHHVHSLVALIFVSIIFWTKDALLQKRLMEAVRYYFLFAMASAAIWKIARGKCV
jgi:hypothetical protein